MGGSVNLQSGGQYQMPSTGAYSGLPASVNAPQTADQYAASQAARQSQMAPRGPISFNPFTGEPDYSYDPNFGADTSNPWGGTPAPVQNPYYAYGNQTAPWMTASQATAYDPMNLPGMQLARPSFYYPSISNQMAFMGGMGGMYGGGLGGMGYGGYMGMPGYFSGLGAMGSYMPMMQRSYPSYSNAYPALGGPARYQPRIPTGPTAYANPPSTSTGGKGMQTAQQSPATPTTPTYNPSLRPVAPPSPMTLTPVEPPVSPSLQYSPSPDRSDARPSWADPLLPVTRTGPANAQATSTVTAVPTPSTQEPEPTLTYERPFEPTYPQTELPPEPTSFDPLAGGGLLGGYTMPDMRLPDGGVNPDLFVPGGVIPTNPQPEPVTYQNDRQTSGIDRGFGETGMAYMEP